MAGRNRLTIFSSYIAAQLLQLAFEKYEICPSRYAILTPRPTSKAEPAAVLIQPGGIFALQQLGYRIETLYASGTAVHGLHVYDGRGRSKWSIEIDPSRSPPALAIESSKLHELLATGTAFETFDQPPPTENVVQQPCNPIMLHLFEGEVRHNGLGLIQDSSTEHIGLVNVGERRVLGYVVGKEAGFSSKDAREAVDGLLRRFDDVVDIDASESQLTVFNLTNIGLYTARSHDDLLWGGMAVGLHPLTGQAISYWAQQALWLASLLRDRDPGNRVVARLSGDNNRRMYRMHRHILDYYLRPSLYWRMVHIPYTLGLRYVPYIRKRARRKLALM